MDNIEQSEKFRKTTIIDILIISATILVSNLAFIVGLYFLGFATLTISIGYIAKTIAIKSYIVMIISSIIGLVGSFLFTYFLYKTDLLPFVLVLVSVFAGCAFAICVINNKSKLFCITITSIVMVFGLILAVFYSYYMHSTETLSLNGCLNYVNQFFETLKGSVEDALTPFAGTLLSGESISEAAETYVNLFKFISPGLVICLCEFASILSSVFFNLSIKQSNAHVVVPSEWSLVPNVFIAHAFLITTIIYYLSSLVVMFGVDSLEVVYLVAINIVMILMPCLFISGIRRLLFEKRKFNSIPRVFVIVIGIVMLIISATFFFILVSSFGATFAIIKARREQQIEQDEENGDNREDIDNNEEEYHNNDYYENDRYNDDYYNDNHDDEYDDEYYDENEDDYYDENNDDYQDDNNEDSDNKDIDRK